MQTIINEARTTFTKQRYGNWMHTFSGKKYYPLDPDAEDVCIEDVAHGLAMTCRYGGQCKFYSVAEHCYILSFICTNKLKAFLHDSPEAYIGDIIRPIKYMPEIYKIYRPIEELNEVAIAKAFGLDNLMDAEIEIKDKQMISIEAPVVFNTLNEDWPLEIVPKIEVECWNPQIAEEKYLERFHELYES